MWKNEIKKIDPEVKIGSVLTDNGKAYYLQDQKR